MCEHRKERTRWLSPFCKVHADVLEREPDTELHLPGVVTLSADHAEGTRIGGVNAKASLRISRSWVGEDRVVEQIGDDILKLQANMFCNVNVFHQTHVNI